MTFTEDQLTEIAGSLEALGEELGTRDWSPDLAGAVMAAAVPFIIQQATMPKPVPMAYLPQPPYSYGMEDFRPSAEQGFPLTVSVHGRTHDEMNVKAAQIGAAFFGEPAELDITLAGNISLYSYDGEGQPVYSCGAIIRLKAAETSGRSRDSGVRLG